MAVRFRYLLGGCQTASRFNIPHFDRSFSSYYQPNNYLTNKKTNKKKLINNNKIQNNNKLQTLKNYYCSHTEYNSGNRIWIIKRAKSTALDKKCNPNRSPTELWKGHFLPKKNEMGLLGWSRLVSLKCYLYQVTKSAKCYKMSVAHVRLSALRLRFTK